MDEQIKCTCTWTNGDATVTCAGQTFLTDLAVNDVAKVDLSGQPPYVVGSITDNTNFELTTPYSGTTGSKATVIQRSFTVNLNLERPMAGDHGWGEFLARVLDKIDGYLGYLITLAYEIVRKLSSPLPTDHSFNGDYFEGIAGENLVFGNLIYLKSDGKWWKGNATAVGTTPCTAMAVATISADATGNLLKKGFARDDSWNWATPGARLYLGETDGVVTDIQPSDSGDQVQVVGQVMDDDNIWFEPIDIVVEV